MSGRQALTEIINGNCRSQPVYFIQGPESDTGGKPAQQNRKKNQSPVKPHQPLFQLADKFIMKASIVGGSYQHIPVPARVLCTDFFNHDVIAPVVFLHRLQGIQLQGLTGKALSRNREAWREIVGEYLIVGSPDRQIKSAVAHHGVGKLAGKPGGIKLSGTDFTFQQFGSQLKLTGQQRKVLAAKVTAQRGNQQNAGKQPDGHHDTGKDQAKSGSQRPVTLHSSRISST